MTLQTAISLSWDIPAGDTITTSFELNMSDLLGQDNTVQSALVLLPGETAYHQENFPYRTTQTSILIIAPLFDVPYWFKIAPLDSNGEYGAMAELPINITPPQFAIQEALLPTVTQPSTSVDRTTKEITISWGNA